MSCEWCVSLYQITISSDLAITITVTSSKEGLGFFVSQCPGTALEVLQEQPVINSICLVISFMNLSDMSVLRVIKKRINCY